MSYKIVVDSCGELKPEQKSDIHFASASLELDVDDYHVVDDESFDQKEFLRRVKESPNCPKSTCPSPERYMTAFEGEAQNVYAVTLSSQLSGSYNSAELGKKLYLEEHENKNIHVFDSKSASIGETLIAMKIQECEEAGMEFQDVVKEVDRYIETQHTFFVLETLDTLRKNGRLSNLKALVAGALNIKPVMGSTPEGAICQLSQARGMNKALEKMVQELLTVSRIEAPQYSCVKTHFDFTQFLRQRLAAFDDLFVQKELSVAINLLPDIYIDGDMGLLQKVVDNLLGNAATYSPPGNSVRVNLRQAEEKVYLTIENTGVHIPEDDISKLFEPFYRVEQSRNRQTGGSGLGLYIVKTIINLHNAEVSVQNTDDGVSIKVIF